MLIHIYVIKSLVNHQKSSFNLEPNPDTGELFQVENDPKKNLSQHVPYNIASTALQVLEVSKPAPAPEQALERLRQNYIQSEDRDDPYRDLGGNVASPEEPPTFERIAAAAQDWMTDVTLAIDNYLLHALEVSDIARMSKPEQSIFALHVGELMKYIDSGIRLIPSVGGDVGCHELHQHRYGKERSTTEMLDYVPLLKDLKQTIESTDILSSLQKATPELKYLSSSERARRYKQDLHKHGHILIMFDQLGKPRVTRAPR